MKYGARIRWIVESPASDSWRCKATDQTATGQTASSSNLHHAANRLPTMLCACGLSREVACLLVQRDESGGRGAATLRLLEQHVAEMRAAGPDASPDRTGTGRVRSYTMMGDVNRRTPWKGSRHLATPPRSTCHSLDSATRRGRQERLALVMALRLTRRFRIDSGEDGLGETVYGEHPTRVQDRCRRSGSEQYPSAASLTSMPQIDRPPRPAHVDGVGWEHATGHKDGRVPCWESG